MANILKGNNALELLKLNENNQIYQVLPDKNEPAEALRVKKPKKKGGDR